jgi:eukaryotic-like serine/threonine-protein kinase
VYPGRLTRSIVPPRPLTQRSSMPSPDDTIDLLLPGTRLVQRYVLGELAGSGGMAQVYRGVDELLSLPVAIKVLTSACAGVSSVVERFFREARASAAVQHENIVEIIDFGETESGRPFMVMELLEGEDLAATLRREGPLPWERARPMLLQLLAALQAAHDRAVIHRDVKPENVFRITRMGNDDFVKVLDFGIAKLLADVGIEVQTLTLEGRVIGTPTYMAPEQCVGLPVDARSDLYAVGILAYEMLTGRPPFDSQEPAQLMFCHVHEEVPPMATVAPDVQVDARPEAVVRRALEKHPKHRYASAREFAEALLSDVDPQQPSLLRSLRGLFGRWR